MKPHSRPTAHIGFDRSFVALSNEITHDAQSSLLMEILALEDRATERVSRDPPSSDGSQNYLKNIDSDSPDDGESESMIRISIA